MKTLMTLAACTMLAGCYSKPLAPQDRLPHRPTKASVEYERHLDEVVYGIPDDGSFRSQVMREIMFGKEYVEEWETWPLPSNWEEKFGPSKEKYEEETNALEKHLNRLTAKELHELHDIVHGLPTPDTNK